MLDSNQVFSAKKTVLKMNRSEIAHSMNQVLPSDDEVEMSKDDERLSDEFCVNFVTEWVKQNVDEMDVYDYEEFILGRWEQLIFAQIDNKYVK